MFIAVRGDWLIDGTGMSPLKDGLVLVQDDKITAVGRADEISLPEETHVLSLKGQTILPGLIEVHGHLGLDRRLGNVAAQGGNFAPIAVAAREAERTCDCLIAVCNYYVAVKKKMDILLEQPEGTVDPQDYRSHGGTMEVSLAMVHSPEDVKLNKFVLGDVSKVLQNQSSTVQAFVSMEEYAPTGAFGHIEGASAQLGRRIIKLASDEMRDDVLRTITTFCKCNGEGHASEHRR